MKKFKIIIYIMKSFAIPLVLFIFFYIMHRCHSSLSFNYERRQMLGSGRRNIPSFNVQREAIPEPLPQRKSKTAPVPLPYHSLYQGRRRDEDKRVFRERFNMGGQPEGQQLSFDQLFDCPITFLSVETECNIPIMLRGGVGHPYFTVIIKAKPYDRMSGQVRAYCLKTEQDYYREKQTPNVAKVYVFTEPTRMPSDD